MLADTANFTFWTLQVEETTGQVRAHHDPTLLMYGVEKDAIGMYAFIPGLYLGADIAADIRTSIKKTTDKGHDTGQARPEPRLGEGPGPPSSGSAAAGALGTARDSASRDGYRRRRDQG